MKFEQIRRNLGSVQNLKCLDIGSDNGVISYKLRQLGGTWSSADIDPRSVQAMRELVQMRVFHIDGESLPFDDGEFQKVVIVDFLEHIPHDTAFMREVHRVLKPGGTLVLNAPLTRDGWLMKFRARLGLTEELHGHLRPGYSIEEFESLTERAGFEIKMVGTHTRTVSKLLDTLMVWAISELIQSQNIEGGTRGVIVERKDLDRHRWEARLFALIYPMVYLTSMIDRLLPFDPGYMIIARALRQA